MGDKINFMALSSQNTGFFSHLWHIMQKRIFFVRATNKLEFIS